MRRHQIVFLGDIHPLAEPKLLVARLIREQPEDLPIDLLALEIAAEQQQWIDRYLSSDPEDTRILLDHPRTLRAHWGVSAEYLDIYRAVYQWNRQHPDRQIRILAADQMRSSNTPLTPRMAAGDFVTRDSRMAVSFRRELQRHPDWRVLIFMGGYHGLKKVGGRVAFGQAQGRFDRWFAGYLLDSGAEVYSILTDARQPHGHGATRVFDQLAKNSSGNFAVALDSTTDMIVEPLHEVVHAGFSLEFWPARFALRDAIDALVVLNQTTPISLLHRTGDREH
ncbi:MAG TPA: hypothetical protein VD930_12205 [Gemmatimonadales bacterium]|nr:hypothetical protein [Gemmatimonadales bacterium]